MKIHVNFIVIYQTKKPSFFVSNKDKIPDLSRNNIIYQITCPGCGHKYIGKTERRLETRLTEHFTNISTSAVAQHLLDCPLAQYIVDLSTFYNNLNSSSLPVSNSPTNLIFNNFKILHSCGSKNPNKLLILEALLIKYNKPEINNGIKASKELSLFHCNFISSCNLCYLLISIITLLRS